MKLYFYIGSRFCDLIIIKNDYLKSLIGPHTYCLYYLTDTDLSKYVIDVNKLPKNIIFKYINTFISYQDFKKELENENIFI